MGIHEALEVDERMRQLIGASADEDALAGSSGVRGAALRLGPGTDTWLVSVLALSAEAVTTALARATAASARSPSPAAVS